MNELKAIVIILGPITLWLALTCLMLGYLLWRLWRCVRKKPGAEWNSRKIAFTVIAFVWVAASFWYGGGVKIYYDFKVSRLCAKDGGVKVYETVTLPLEKFNEVGYTNFFDPTQKENALGPEYIYKWEITDLRSGKLNIYRSSHEVTRRADGKKLGETTLYIRSGGDYLPILGHPSSYSCPPIPKASSDALFKRIFINSTQ